MRRSPSRKRVLIIGTEDVDARIELMQALADEFTLAAAGTKRGLTQRFSERGFAFYYYPMGRGANPLLDMWAFRVLLRVLNVFRPQVVHSFDRKPCVYGGLAACLAGVPVVLGTIPGLGSLYVDNKFVSDSLPRRVARGFYETLQRLVSHRANFTIFQNQDDAREFLAKRVVPRDRVKVIPGSGVRTELFDRATISRERTSRIRAELGIPGDAVLVTMVSRVIRSKGIEDFVAAAHRVRERHPSAHFLLVGPDDEQSVDRFTAEELGRIAKLVLWPGARRDIVDILAASDVFAFPSFYREGIPRVLLEAASMGLPIVTTQSPGCIDVVRDGVNGFLVPGRDVQALASAIDRLVACADIRRRFGEASRRHAVSQFNVASVVQQTRTLYRGLLAESPRDTTRLLSIATPDLVA